jgi:signal transduction histidine kinase
MRRTLHPTQLLPSLAVSMLAALALAVLIWAGIRGWACSPSLVYLPGQCNSIPGLVAPLLTALGIWGIGVVIWCAEKHVSTAGFFWVIAASLASGAVSGAGDLTAGRLFYLTLAWLAPFSLNFHQNLLGHPRSSRSLTGLRISFGIAVLWSLPLLAFTVAQLQAIGVFSWLRIGVRLTLLVALGAGLSSLWRGYRSGLPLPAARRVQVLVLGSLLAFAPLLLLSVIPETLGAPVYVPYELTCPWLLLSPITYLYASYRKRLGPAEPALRHFAGYFSVAIIFLALYLGLLALTGAPDTSRARTLLAGALLSGAAVLVIAKVYPELTVLTRRSLQGKPTSGAVLDSLAERLSLAHDRLTLQGLLMHDVPRAFGAPIVVFLTRRNGVLVSEAHENNGDSLGAAIQLPLVSTLARAVTASARPLPAASVQMLSQQGANTESEHALLMHAGLDLLVPLRAGGELQGLLGLGAKLSDDAWSIDDLRALSVLGWQAGAALQNLQLLDEVQAGQDGLARAHRQSLVEQDRQQRELAQELHDGPVQQLLGVSYQLATLQSHESAAGPDSAAIRREVLAAADQLRDVIGRLRPAGLTELGLTSALRDYIARVQRTIPNGSPRLRLHIGTNEPELSAEVSLCLFRCAQEALRNALRHAQASVVVVELRIENDQARLIIEDDGCGFQVPHRLSELAQTEHFGLVGIAERVEWLGGMLEIRSLSNEGTLLSVILPLSSAGNRG